MFLGIFGPLLTAIGALVVARDIMKGPALWYWDVESPIRGKKIRKENHEAVIQSLRNKPCPPYTQGKIAELELVEISRFKESEFENKKLAAKHDLKKRLISQNYAIRGLILIAIGSLMQSMSVLFK